MSDYSLMLLALIFVPIIIKLGLDVRKLERENTQLKKLVTIDSLTKVGNRRSLDVTLEEEVNRSIRSGNSMIFGIVDVDRFKEINSLVGYAKADTILTGIAEIISGNLRNTDKVFRYGGDEFAVIMPHTNAEEAEVVLSRISQLVIKKLQMPDNPSIAVSVSIGITEFPNGNLITGFGRDSSLIISDLITQASEALLKHAKNTHEISVYNKLHHTT